jgi:predicted dithiol-disulfide oxidoreductase (DUF899 family)
MTDAPSRTHADVGLPEVVSPAEWRASFEAMLTREKALTAARDEMSAARRRMPMMRVDTGYRFVGPAGEVGLLELFEGRRQLIVYRFFYAPDVEGWPEGACSGCSMFADSITHPAHLNARDTTLAFVSAVPQERIETYRDRMGWSVPWYTLVGDDFSRDFDVEEYFGLNVFIRDDNAVSAHTSSTGVVSRQSDPRSRSSTSRRSAARSTGRTPRRIARRATRTSGGDDTTSTAGCDGG